MTDNLVAGYLRPGGFYCVECWEIKKDKTQFSWTILKTEGQDVFLHLDCDVCGKGF